MEGYDGKVVLYTGFYNRQAVAPYCDSLVKTVMVLEKLNIAYDYWCCPSDFHVERHFSTSMTKFLNSDYTDFFNIDSDISWDPTAVVRFLLHPEEVVAASYRMKNRWDVNLGHLVTKDGEYMGKMLKDGTALLEATRVPLGFARIKKSAVQKYVEKYPDEWFHTDEGKAYNFIMNEVRDNIFVSMDYSFAERMRSVVGQLWIDPNVTLGHWGMSEYPLNLDKHLRAQKVMSALGGGRTPDNG